MVGIINPYNFVRFDSILPLAQREQPPGFHHRLSGHSGRLVCTLTTLTRIFIPHSQRNLGSSASVRCRYFSRRGIDTSGVLIIPGSSLKGVLRSVVEALSSSGFTFFDGIYSPVTTNPRIRARLSSGSWRSPSGRVFPLSQNRRGNVEITADYTSGLPPSLSPSGNRLDRQGNSGQGRGLDVASRLFGVAPAREDQQGGTTEEPFQAKVRLGDAEIVFRDAAGAFSTLSIHAQTAVQEDIDWSQQLSPTDWAGLGPFDLSEPKPHHEPFYLEDPSNASSPIRGRKFYLHRATDDLPAQAPDRGTLLELVKAGVRFWFIVDYAELTEAELGLLCRALVLTPQMAYKIGMGKPLGLGSVKLAIVALEDSGGAAVPARWSDFGGGSLVTGPATESQIQGWVGAFDADCELHCRQAWADLQEIWRWPPFQNATVTYPSRRFFTTAGSTPLPMPAQMGANPLNAPEAGSAPLTSPSGNRGSTRTQGSIRITQDKRKKRGG